MLKAKRPRTAAELFGQREIAKSGRERLEDIAIELFYLHGFNAVGIDQVLAEAGVTKTTFYKHFESKDDLIISALKKRDRMEREAWQRAVRTIAGDDPREQLLGLLDVVDIWFNDPQFRGCLFINAATEFPNPNDPIHQAAAEHKRATRDQVRDMAAAAGADDPETFADIYTMLLEGVFILRHVHNRDDAARMAKPQFERLIAESIPAAV